MLLLDPAEYPLSDCADLMRDARQRLDEERGVLVLDRLPLEQYTAAGNPPGLLAARLAPRATGIPIDSGEVMVDVTDTGIKKTIGVRGFRTNSPQPAHTDNSFNHCPPDYVSLLSLSKARTGGVSKFISFYTVHSEMRRRYPALLPRLYRPFYQDRQGDYRPRRTADSVLSGVRLRGSAALPLRTLHHSRRIPDGGCAVSKARRAPPSKQSARLLRTRIFAARSSSSRVSCRWSITAGSDTGAPSTPIPRTRRSAATCYGSGIVTEDGVATVANVDLKGRCDGWAPRIPAPQNSRARVKLTM